MNADLPWTHREVFMMSKYSSSSWKFLQCGFVWITHGSRC